MITYCQTLFFVTIIVFILFVLRVENEYFRSGTGSPYFNSNTILLGEQTPHKFSKLRYLP